MTVGTLDLQRTRRTDRLFYGGMALAILAIVFLGFMRTFYLSSYFGRPSPSTLRAVLRSGPFAEGWAVYTEQMMLDQGYGDRDLALRLSQLKFYLRAVGNAMLDHKMHCTSMTDDEARLSPRLLSRPLSRLAVSPSRRIDPSLLTTPIAPGRPAPASAPAAVPAPVAPDQPARVLVDEQSGLIVMGENVRISQVAIAQGNLTVRITETPQVSQPNPLAEGDTVVVPRTSVEVAEGGGRNMVLLPEGVSLQELVAGLNALGVQPRDLISILQAIKAAGALQAEIVVM